MRQKQNQQGNLGKWLLIAALLAGGFGYEAFFGSDRAQVQSCIKGMMEASRGTMMYSELRQKLATVNAADAVVIERKERRAIGNNVLLTLHYSTDGRRGSMMCSG